MRHSHLFFTAFLLVGFTAALQVNIAAPISNSNYSNSSLSVNFEIDNSSATSCVLQLNNVNVTAQNNCANTTVNAVQGLNSLLIHANDSEGNYTQSSLVNFTVDSITPTYSTQITRKSSYAVVQVNSSENSNITFNYWTNASNVINVQNALFVQSNELNLTNLTADTVYNYNFTICDSFSNCNASPNASFTTNTLPVVTINAPLASSINSNQITLNATASDNSNIVKVWFLITNNTYNTTINASQAQNSATWNATLNTTALADGSYNVTAFAQDDSQEENSTSTIQFSIDNTAPSVQVYYIANNSKVNSSTVNLNYTASDANLATCSYTLDVGQNISLANCANATVTNLTEATHSLLLFANDSTGKTTLVQVNFTVDLTAPVIGSLNYDRVNTSVNLTWTTSELANYTIKYGVNNTFDITTTSPTLSNSFNVQFGLEYAKTYNFNVFACDAAGNCVNQTVTVAMPNAPASLSSQSSDAQGGAAAAPATEANKQTTPPAAQNKTESAKATPVVTKIDSQIATQANETTNAKNERNATPISAFATAQDKDNFAMGLALLSGLSILMYGYRQQLLQRVKPKRKKGKQFKKDKKTYGKEHEHKEKNRFSFLSQVSSKKTRFPVEYKTHSPRHVEKVKFKQGSLASHIANAIKQRL